METKKPGKKEVWIFDSMNRHNISLSDVRVHENSKFSIIVVPLGLNLAPGCFPVSFSAWKQNTTVEDRSLETTSI